MITLDQYLLTQQIIAACTLGAILYRCGGMDKECAKPEYIPRFLRKSWVRDWTLPILPLLVSGYFVREWIWIYVAYYVLSALALSTYWDWLFKKDNFYMHGFGCGATGLILIFVGIPLWVVIIRMVLCTVGMGLWSSLTQDDVFAERGRGVFFIL